MTNSVRAVCCDSDGASDKEYGAFPEPLMTALMKTAAFLNGEEDEIASIYSLISSDRSRIKRRVQHIA